MCNAFHNAKCKTYYLPASFQPALAYKLSVIMGAHDRVALVTDSDASDGDFNAYQTCNVSELEL